MVSWGCLTSSQKIGEMELTIKGLNTGQFYTNLSYLVNAIEERRDLKRLTTYGRNECAVFLSEKGFFLVLWQMSTSIFHSFISSALK
jgi:hypothetical protein